MKQAGSLQHQRRYTYTWPTLATSRATRSLMTSCRTTRIRSPCPRRPRTMLLPVGARMGNIRRQYLFFCTEFKFSVKLCYREIKGLYRIFTDYLPWWFRIFRRCCPKVCNVNVQILQLATIYVYDIFVHLCVTIQTYCN